MNAPSPEVAQSSKNRRVVRRTRAVCPTCLVELDAMVVVDDRGAVLERTCPEHGVASQVLSTHGDHWAELDGFFFDVNPKPAPQRDFIVRMTERCNLDCPICLAKANTEDTPDLDLSGLERLLSERRGLKVDLMAAEPTLRDDLEDWVRQVRDAGHIAALHTNGIRLADRDYVKRLKAAGVEEVFLQFDGFDDDANQALRGARLLKRRLKAVENLREEGLATSLVVVIAGGLNEAQIGETYRFALRPENDHIREILFLGLRLLGSARDALVRGDGTIGARTLMPDDLITEFCAQVEGVDRDDIRRFNKAYFSLLSAARVRKCLYIQQHLVVRTAAGPRAFGELVDLERVEAACERYRTRFKAGDRLARPRLMASLARCVLRPQTLRAAKDLLRLQDLLRDGMNLSRVPPRMLLVGFITACDPENWDAGVAAHCGKGELSVDGGYEASGADANIARERRFTASDLRPGALHAWKDRVSPDR